MLKSVLFQWFLGLLLINFRATFGQEEPTGLIVKVNQHGLQFVKKQVNQSISELPSAIAQNPVTFEKSGLKIINTGLNDIEIGNIILTPKSPNLLTVGIERTSFVLTGNFTYTKWFGSINGKIEASINDLRIVQKASFGRNNLGGLTVTSERCHASVGSIAVTTSGTFLAALANLAVPAIETQLRKQIKHAICPVFEQRISSLASNFDGNVNLTTHPPTSIDFTLTQPPSLSRNHIAFSTVGRVFPTANSHVTENVPQSNLSPLSDSSKMIQISISDFVFNTFLHTATHHGLLDFTVTPKKAAALTGLNLSPLGKTSRNNLNIPAGASVTTELLLRPSYPPFLTFRNNLFNIIGNYTVYKRTLANTNSLAEELLLECSVNVTASLQTRKNNLRWRIHDIDFDLATNDLPRQLVRSLRRAANDAILNVLNADSAEGNRHEIPLLWGDYSFRRPEIHFRENSIEFATDLHIAANEE